MKLQVTYSDEIDCIPFGNLVHVERPVSELEFIHLTFDSGVMLILRLTQFMKCKIQMTDAAKAKMRANIEGYLKAFHAGEIDYKPSDEEIEFARQFL